MRDASDDLTGETLRHLFHCKALAGERYRAAIARSMAIGDTEAAALAHLARQGQLTPGKLGDLLGLTSGGTTALVHRLEGCGYLARQPHPRDKRSILLTATPSAVARAEELYRPLVRDMDAVADRLTGEERVVVGRYLMEVVAVSERHAERLDAEARAEVDDVVSTPTPGLWA